MGTDALMLLLDVAAFSMGSKLFVSDLEASDFLSGYEYKTLVANNFRVS